MTTTNIENSNFKPSRFNWKHPTCFENASLLGQWAIDTLAEKPPGRTFTDLGAGKCALINACSRLPQFHFLKAVDDEHYGSFCDSACEFIHQDIEHYLATSDEQNEDVIVCEKVLNGILDTGKVSRILSFIFYRLAEHGSFLCSAFVITDHTEEFEKQWSQKGLESLLESHGFVIERPHLSKQGLLSVHLTKPTA